MSTTGKVQSEAAAMQQVQRAIDEKTKKNTEQESRNQQQSLLSSQQSTALYRQIKLVPCPLSSSRPLTVKMFSLFLPSGVPVLYGNFMFTPCTW